jgi:hypothetical protein
MPIDRLQLTVTAPHLAAAIVREVDVEAGTFSFELDAGADVRFEIEALRQDVVPEAPTYWGALTRDLAPREAVDLSIPVFPAGGLAGEVRLYDGKPIPAGATMTLTAEQPPPDAPAEIEVPVSNGPLHGTLPAGGYAVSIRVEQDGVAYLPLSAGELFLFVEHGVIIDAGVLILAPPDYCRPVEGVYPDADDDGSPCDVDCADMTSEYNTLDVDGDQVSTCDGDCDDLAAGCTTDCVTDQNGNQIPDCRETCSGDADFDRVCDQQDNCPSVPNPDQTDLDNDQLGDACDQDKDGDGVLEPGDNCPDEPNALQEDSDHDGFGLACDIQDSASSCTTDDRDLDLDSVKDCLDRCLSNGTDPTHGFTLRQQIVGRGKVPVEGCTVDGTLPCALTEACVMQDSIADLDNDGRMDMIDDCLDADGDLAGYDGELGWSTGVRIDMGSATQMVQQPAVAFQPYTSVVYVVWADNWMGSLDVFLNRSVDAGLGWSGATSIGTAVSAEDSQPAVAVSGSGAVHVVWANNEASDYDLYYRSSPDGLDWAAQARSIIAVTGSNQKHPVIAVAEPSWVFVAWEDDRNGDVDIYYSVSNDGGATFQPGLAVHGVLAGDQLDPVIAVDGLGDPWIAWEDRRVDITGDIHLTRGYGNGAAFPPSVRLDDDPGTSAQLAPTLAFDPKGSLLVAWEDARAGYAAIRATRKVETIGRFAPSQHVTGDATVTAHSPSLGIDPLGVAHLAWAQDDSGGGFDLFAAQSGDGGQSWRLPRVIVASSTVNDREVSLGVGADGVAVAAWSNGTAGAMQVQVALRKRGCPRGSDCNDDPADPAAFHCALDCVNQDGDSACRDQDCNDFESAVFPGNVEVCDFKDNDCNKRVDDGEVVGIDHLFGDMEDGAAGWTTMVYSGGVTDWAPTSTSSSGALGPVTFPSMFFGTNGNNGSAEESEDSALVSPVFDIPEGVPIGLTFASYNYNEGGCPGGLGADGEEIEVQWLGSNLSRLNVCGDPQINTPYSGEILHPWYDLSAAAGQAGVQLRFHLNTNGSAGNGKDDGWYIDDVRVYSCP